MSKATNKAKKALAAFGKKLNKNKANIARAVLALGATALLVHVVYYSFASPTQTFDKPVELTPVSTSSSPNSSSAEQTLISDEKRTVILSGEVAGQSRGIAKQITELDQKNHNKPIYLLINSPGGSVGDGALIMQAIEASKAPVYTVCTQFCASMAAMIFEFGKQRFIANRAILMFHPASGGLQGEVDKMASRVLFIQKWIGEMEAYVANKAGLTFTEYKRLAGNEIWVTGAEAVSRHFADSLVHLSGTQVYSEELSFSGGLRAPKKAKQIGEEIIHITPQIDITL